MRPTPILLGLSLAVLTPGCMMNDGDDMSQRSGAVAFMNLRVEDIGAGRAVVRFDTNIPTTCEASYGIVADVLDLSATDPNMVPGNLAMGHNVPLEDLMSSQTYFWRAMASNRDGKTYTSERFQFVTLASDQSPGIKNVAVLGAGATVMGVSSNFGGVGNDASFGVNNAFDGMMATEWSSNGDGNDAWVELDFGQKRSLATFGFRSREMSDGTSIIQSVRLVFDGGETTAGPFMTPDPTVRYTFDFEQPISASTVRIEAVDTTGGNTGAREIEFFAQD